MRIKEEITGVFILLALSVLTAGCSAQGDSEMAIAVTPETKVLTLGVSSGDSQQFSATSGGTPVTSVTWSVIGATGGNSANGTIDADGLYTAPLLGAIDISEVPERVSIKATDTSGAFGTATAFLTTINANKPLTQYTPGVFRADTYSGGQRSIATYKDGNGDVHVYAVWADKSSGTDSVWFVKSDDGGIKFDDPVVVDEGIFGSQISPVLAVHGSSGNVFVVWEDAEEGDRDIFIKKYDGAGFSAREKVNQDIGGSQDYDTTPSIAINSLGHIYVVWEHRESSLDNYPDIYFAKSITGGNTFSSPTTIAFYGRRPAIAVDLLDTSYIVWEDITGFPDLSYPTHIKINKISSGGTLGTEKQVDTTLITPYDHARYPSVAVGPGGDVYVVWQRALIFDPDFIGEIITSYDIDLARVDEGTLDVLDAPAIFPDAPGASIYGVKAYPSIAADATNIYVAWDDQRNGTKDIYFAKSSNGAVFTTNRIVNDNVGDNTWHEKPSIAAADGKAYIIWTDYRNTRGLTTSCLSDICPNDVFFAREE